MNTLMTVFTVMFAVAAITTLLLGLHKPWKRARVISATVAVLSFLAALISATFAGAR